MNHINYSTPLAALDCVVLDTETTGLDARTARLLQIGAVRIHEGHVPPSPVLEVLVDPGVPIPAAATAIHGIGNGDIAGAPRFAECAEMLAEFIGSRIVIGHTIAYDLMILGREARLANCEWHTPRSLDVRILAELAEPGLAQYDLDRIATTFGIRIEGRHTALGDAKATAQVFIALLPVLRARGIRTIAEAEAAARQLADRQLLAGNATLDAHAYSAAPAVLTRIDSFPYRHRLADVMSAPAVWCEPQASLLQAMQMLIDGKISSVLVGGGEAGAGIVTERDLLRAIARDPTGSLEQKVGSIASRPLHALPHDAYVYRAIGRIGRLGIRHLAVTEADGEIVGMVTTRNLLRHRATTAIVLGDGIDSASTPAALGKVWAQLTTMARSLLDEGVDPRNVAGVISEEVAAATCRAAELAEARMTEDGHGSPPTPYAVLVLGSAGRGESLLAADQDNAIVYEKGRAGGSEDLWFEKLGRHIADILDEVGVPYCKGGVMARNAAWRHSVEGWRTVIDGWIRRQRPEDLLNVDIFFDGVVVHGERSLGDEILSHAFDQAAKSKSFLMHLAMAAPRSPPPIGWLGGIKAAGDGRLDLKLHGLLPIFTAARFLAITHGIRERSTPQRLQALATQGVASETDVGSLVEAHRNLMGFMLGQQLADAEVGIRLSPRVAIGRLDADTKSLLKAALQAVAIASELVMEGRV